MEASFKRRRSPIFVLRGASPRQLIGFWTEGYQAGLKAESHSPSVLDVNKFAAHPILEDSSHRHWAKTGPTGTDRNGVFRKRRWEVEPDDRNVGTHRERPL
jgi:hypothetical protein